VAAHGASGAAYYLPLQHDLPDAVSGFSFTVFETAQCAVAFAVSLSGGLQMAPVMAVVMLVCGAACYVVSFVLLERQGASSRNFFTYSTFGILLALAGSRILLSSGRRPGFGSPWR